MTGPGSRFTLGKKMYVFVIATVLFTAASVCAISFAISANQIDRYFKSFASNCAANAATFVDPDYLTKLRKVAESQEYQTLRDTAEETEDESLVEEYLEEKGLWEQYQQQRELLRQITGTMKDVKYLYVIVMGDIEAMRDMYLLDADDVPVYETGYYEKREKDFAGMDMNNLTEPVISDGEWGWLCSSFAPVYDRNGNIICQVGCDIGMEEVMNERYTNLKYMIMSTIICMVMLLAGSVFFINKSVVSPLDELSKEMKKFSPSENCSYDEAGVMREDFSKSDEIGDIYHEIRQMQIRIIDYINDITAIERDKQKAEDDVRNKDMEIGKISREAFKDPLTGTGNKAAYLRKISELNAEIEKGNAKFAIVMADVNGLKMINDNHGHTAGDMYIRDCCDIVCKVFRNSPVFRVGGDEFVAVISGQDYEERDEKLDEVRSIFDALYHKRDREPCQRCSSLDNYYAILK